MHERLPVEYCEPPFAEWPQVLSRNLARTGGSDPRLRRSVLERAAAFEADLTQRAAAVGIELEPARRATGESGPLVMAGHQPVIYHPGLLEKNRRLSASSSALRASALNVIIDTDEGDAGSFYFPSRSSGAILRRKTSLATGPALYLEQRILGKQEIVEAFDPIARSALELGLSAARLDLVMDLYRSLAGFPVVLANSIARRVVEGPRAYWEVPLSHILELPAVERFYARFLDRPTELFRVYNETLQEHRKVRKIKNPANPFPNLRRNEQSLELPFWLIERQAGIRRPLFYGVNTADFRAGDKALPLDLGAPRFGLPQSFLVAPRGALITALLRSKLSDLFIHGLGGAKYDVFTESFFRRWSGEELPAFAVASSGQYLFSEKIDGYEEGIQWKHRMREVVSHVDRFVGKGLFTPELERRLAELSVKRKREIAIDARSPEVHRTSREIKNLVEDALRSRIEEAEKVSPQELEAWYFRQYPVFFFAG